MPVRVDEQVDASACASCLGQMHWHFSGPDQEGLPFSPDRCEPTSVTIFGQRGLIEWTRKPTIQFSDVNASSIYTSEYHNAAREYSAYLENLK